MLHNGYEAVNSYFHARPRCGKLPNMAPTKSQVFAALGRSRSPAKIAAARENAAKATAARTDRQTPEERSAQARKAAKAMHAKREAGKAAAALRRAQRDA